MTNRAKQKERAEIRRRGLPSRAHPSEALKLLHDSALLGWAANPWLNSHWHHAKMTTKGRDGLTVLDAFPDASSAKKWAGEAMALLKLDLASMKAGIPPLKVVPITKKRKWDPEYDSTKKRDIVIPCILRRVLSAHLAYILAITTSGRLSKAARAYVEGIRDPAPTVAKEVARLAQQGYFYYAKFDLTDAFNTIGWKPLRRALLQMGYPQRFVDILMLFVQAPVERRVRGHWLRQRRSRGALAGLPESGILLNILMREIDERILRGGSVHYTRYSDDQSILARTIQDGARAAKLFVSWVWAVGMDVKGVPRHSDPSRFVKDIRLERLELLGIEIDHQGDLHIPQGKGDGQLARLSHFVDLAIQTPHLVVGHSRYALEAPQRGIAVADQGDLDEMVAGFYQYWLHLNRAEAELFRSSASAGVSFGTSRKAHGPHRKLFVAVLGPKSAHSPLRAGGESGSSHPSLSDWVDREVLPLVEECLELDPGVRQADHRPTGIPSLGMRRHSGVEERLASLTPRHGTSGPGNPSLDIASLPHSSVGFDGGASDGLSEVDASDTAPADPWDHPARNIGWSQGALANTVFCFVDVRSVDTDTVVVGIQEFTHDGIEVRARHPLLRVRRHIEGAVAHLQALADRRRAAAEHGRPFVALGPSWLPKQLLVAERSFRRVGIYALIVELHRQAAREDQTVLVVGPVRMPALLMKEMGTYERHDQVQFARRNSATPPP
jgi:hypothetical protein